MNDAELIYFAKVYKKRGLKKRGISFETFLTLKDMYDKTNKEGTDFLAGRTPRRLRRDNYSLDTFKTRGFGYYIRRGLTVLSKSVRLLAARRLGISIGSGPL